MPDPISIAVEITHPPLPEGWTGTPNELIQWMDENAMFKASGAFLTGQIGGARPLTNVGLFVNGTAIEVWRGGSDGKYVPLMTVPLGAVYDWHAGALTPPENHLFCEGQPLVIADYADLFAVVGKTYNRPDDLETVFRLPDYRGRYSVGAGDAQGDENPKRDAGVANGNLSLRSPGQYFGHEWITVNVPTPPGASATRRTITGIYGGPPNFYYNSTKFHTVVPPSIAARKVMRVR